MADGEIDNLLAALREVAANQPDPNDDDSDWNEDDPADDNDTRSYDPDEADEENAEDQDQESDFRRRKPLGTVMLLAKLDAEAEDRHSERCMEAGRERQIKPALTKVQEKNAKLLQMRRKADKAEFELKLNKQLKTETLRLQKANVKLYKANLTATDRMELENNDWREEARASFGSQYQPPVNGRISKTV